MSLPSRDDACVHNPYEEMSIFYLRNLNQQGDSTPLLAGYKLDAHVAAKTTLAIRSTVYGGGAPGEGDIAKARAVAADHGDDTMVNQKPMGIGPCM